MHHKKSFRDNPHLQNDLMLQTKALNRRLERNKMNGKAEENKMNRRVEENKPKTPKSASRSPLNILDQLDVDGEKVLNTLTFLFDQYKENKDKEILNKILNEIARVNNNINSEPESKPQIKQLVEKLFNKLNKIDFEKTLSILTLIYQLYKGIMNENENEVEVEDELENEVGNEVGNEETEKETTRVNNKITIEPESKLKTEQVVEKLFNKLNKIDFEKTLSTLTLIYQLYKGIMNEDEDEVEDDGTEKETTRVNNKINIEPESKLKTEQVVEKLFNTLNKIDFEKTLNILNLVDQLYKGIMSENEAENDGIEKEI